MLTILILEDSPTALYHIESVVSKLIPQSKIIKCKTYGEAIEAVDNQAVDMAFVDLQMPEKNGADFIVHMREVRQNQMIKIFVVTGTGEDTLIKMSITPLVDGYLHKPVSAEEIRPLLKGLPVALKNLEEDNQDDFHELYRLYKKENDQCFLEIQRAFDQNQTNQVEKLAHKMKGSSLILDEQRLTQLCEKIENQAQKGKISTLDWNAFLENYQIISKRLGSHFSGDASN